MENNNIKIIIIFALTFFCFPLWAMDDDEERHDESSQLSLCDNVPFLSFAKRNKLLDKTSEFYKGLNDQDMTCESEEIQNAHRDAFMRGAATTAIEFGIGTLGIATAGVVKLLAAAGDDAANLRIKLEELDDSALSTPTADAFYALYTGCTYQESLQNMKTILKAGEVINATKKRIADFIGRGLIRGSDKIGLTEENITKIAAFVHGSMQTAPAYIQEKYKVLLKKNQHPLPSHLTEYIAQEQRRVQRYYEALHSGPANSIVDKKIKKVKRQKALLDKSFKGDEEHAISFVTQMLQEQQMQYQQAFAMYVDTAFEQAKTDGNRQKDYDKSSTEIQWREFIENTEDSFNGVAAIATIFGKHREARAVATIGSAAIHAVASVQALAQKGFGNINPYVSMLTAVATISTLFQENDGEDNSQVILDAIVQGVMHLSQQMYRFRNEVMEQFELVHRNHNKHHRIMLEQFFTLHQDQATVREKLKLLGNYVKENQQAIQDGLDSLRKTVDNHFRITVSNLNGLRIEEIDDLVERSLLMLQRKDVSSEEFSRCLEKLYIKATSRASADALTGGIVDIHSSEALAMVLEGLSSHQNVFEHPAFSNTNLLSRFIEGNFLDFKHEKLVNPLIWIKCVDAFFHMIDQKLEHDAFYPPTENTKDLDIQKLLILKEQGEKLVTFIEKIDQNRYVEQIVHMYQQRLQELAQAIEQEQKSFEEKETQQLRAEHSAFIVNEEAKTKRIITSYECKKCVELITTAINHSTAQHVFNAQMLRNVALGYFRGQLSPCIHLEKVSLWSDELKPITPEKVRNPNQFFEGLHQQFAKVIAERDARLLKSTNVELATSHLDPGINSSNRRWLYPEGDDDSNLPILMIPVQDLPISLIYTVAENRGLGIISHEYSIVGKALHIQSYFSIKDSHQKIKILHISKECSFDPLYTLPENILHIWYGGRYPKSTDTYSISGQYFMFKRIVDYPAFSGHYPPSKSYSAERDTFVSSAQKEPDQSGEFASLMLQKLEDDRKEKRLQFNKEILAQMALRLPSSAIFKAAQELDLYFKIVDSLLTLMYNDLIQDRHSPVNKQFIALKSNDDEHCIKNLDALTKYLQNYSAKNNPEHCQGNYLPFYLRSTTAKITGLINEITSECKPGFNSVTRVLDSINLLIINYRMRAITPRILPLKEASEEEGLLARIFKQNEGKDKKIEELTASNKELAAETRMAKQELASVKEQLQAVMKLLLEMKQGSQQEQ